MIKVMVDDPEVSDKISNGGKDLRDLCRKEVESFHQYLIHYGCEYREGLSKFERLAIEGYLYQKLRGHIDGFVEQQHET